MHIKTQNDYNYYIEVLLYLQKQLLLGVEPKYMVSMHYQHPVEHSKPLKETDKPYGFGDRYSFTTMRNIWNEVPLYNYWEKRRNDEETSNNGYSKGQMSHYEKTLWYQENE